MQRQPIVSPSLTGAPEATDPVCRMRVSIASARTAEFDGRRYFFCSEECAAEFERDPGRFDPPASQR